MKITEIVLDKILDSFIFEQAFRRRDVETRITSLSLQVVKHLIKILKWRDDINYNKHCRDIDGWVSDIQDLYIKGDKKPTQADYFQWMFNDVVRDESMIERNIRSMSRTYILPSIRSDDEVFQLIKSILYQLSYDLPLNKVVSILDYLPQPE
jgi:hypothetical protein